LQLFLLEAGPRLFVRVLLEVLGKASQFF